MPHVFHRQLEGRSKKGKKNKGVIIATGLYIVQGGKLIKGFGDGEGNIRGEKKIWQYQIIKTD